MAKCHIQWLYLAVHGCKTYLNRNLNLPYLGYWQWEGRGDEVLLVTSDHFRHY
jgi:hypothetical protein